MEYDSKEVWDARAASDEMFLLTTVILADRRAGHRGPSSAFKPWGDVLRLAVSPEWLIQLRNRVLANYHGPKTLPKKPVVTYLARQDSSRRLFHEDHDALWQELQKLESEGIAEVNMDSFNSSIPFDHQVARIARTTVSEGGTCVFISSLRTLTDFWLVDLLRS